MSLSSKHLLAGLLWCALLGLLYLFMSSQIRPKLVTPDGSDREIVIPRSRDTHFYVAGRIDGHAVAFMVDTGASTVVVSQSVATRLNLPRGQFVMMNTAGGIAQCEEVTGRTIMLGGITIHNVRVLVAPNMKEEALLGQNVLRHLDVVQTAERMTLRARPR